MKILRKVLVIIFSLIFFAYVAYQAFFQSPWTFTFSSSRIFFMVLLTVFYSGGICLVGLSWVYSLRIKSQELSLLHGLRTYFLAGIGKYLPGNLGHHVGRVWILNKEANIPKTWVSTTLIIEFVLAFVASFLLSIPCLFRQFSLLKDWNFSIFLGALAVLAIVAALGLVLLSRKLKDAAAEYFRLLMSEKGKLLKAFALMLLAFFVMSLSFAVLGVGVGIVKMDLMAPFLFAFPLAWILGYLTPGSPAGMGSRELALVMLLSGYAPQGEVSQIAILMRIVSLSSDVILYLSGYFLSKRALSYEC